jgi:hypothetical protein
MGKHASVVSILEVGPRPIRHWYIDCRDGTSAQEVRMSHERGQDIFTCTCGRKYTWSPGPDYDDWCVHIIVVCSYLMESAGQGSIIESELRPKIVGLQPEFGFLSPTKYTNGFFGFSFPLPKDIRLEIGFGIREPRRWQHCLFTARNVAQSVYELSIFAQKLDNSRHAGKKKLHPQWAGQNS